MADIELVIKIPENEYKRIEWKANMVTNVEWWEYAINNGTPLNDVLDKIRAEIESYVSEEPHQLMSKTTVLEIIDKYREEQENE